MGHEEEVSFRQGWVAASFDGGETILSGWKIGHLCLVYPSLNLDR